MNERNAWLRAMDIITEYQKRGGGWISQGPKAVPKDSELYKLCAAEYDASHQQTPRND